MMILQDRPFYAPFILHSNKTGIKQNKELKLAKLNTKHSRINENKENIMNWKYAPYIVILAFSIIITVFRFFMIPEWSVAVQILLFVLQFVLLVGIWGLINLLGKYFDTRIPFDSNPARRMMVQIASPITLPETVARSAWRPASTSGSIEKRGG